MARKKKHEEHENLERWLISYADFITLLFAFFVVMYSISAVNEGKFRVLSDSLVAAFRSQPKSMEPLQIGNPLKSLTPQMMTMKNLPTRPTEGISMMPPPMQQAIHLGQAQTPGGGDAGMGKAAEELKEISAALEQALAPFIEQDLVKVRRSRLWMEVEIKTSILFPSGSARLSPSALDTLDKIAEILARYPNPIHVEGFTDNRPISTVAYPSNWELSAARAASVVHLFSQSRVSPDRLAAVGYGEFHPAESNDSAEGRNANRRVVLVILAAPGTRRPLDFVGAHTGATAVEAPAPAEMSSEVTTPPPRSEPPPTPVTPKAQEAPVRESPAAVPAAAPRPVAEAAPRAPAAPIQPIAPPITPIRPLPAVQSIPRASS
jgi:chemotaxis protein MotB